MTNRQRFSFRKLSLIFGPLVIMPRTFGKGDHNMFLKRRRKDTSDIKWTFYFEGLPNDPMVKIDTRIGNVLNNSSENTNRTDNKFQEDSLESLLDSEIPAWKLGMSMSLSLQPSGPSSTPDQPSLIPPGPSSLSPYPVPNSNLNPSLNPIRPPSGLLLPTRIPFTRYSDYPSLLPSNSRKPIHSDAPSVQSTESQPQTYLPTATNQHPSTASHSPVYLTHSRQPSMLPSLSAHPTTGNPTEKPSMLPSLSPRPTTLSPTTFNPSVLPTLEPTMLASNVPTSSISPSAKPSKSFLPSTSFPSLSPSLKPSTTQTPSSLPSGFPSLEPSKAPTDFPSTSPSQFPSKLPTANPSSLPSTSFPSNSPSYIPSLSLQPSLQPSATPTLSECSMTAQQRIDEILAILDNVTDPVSLRNATFPQYHALQWLLHEDGLLLCPANSKHIVQRWTLAVLYYATEGDAWFKCSNNAFATDNCGSESPFHNGERRFLSSVHECEWAGLVCNIDRCVTEFEFERNNINGFIPTEIGLLHELEVLGMEEGGLKGSIPNEIGQLSNLVFIDLDFNFLSGSLPAGLFSLTNMQQLDLNDNLLTGSISGIGAFPSIDFFQLHDNFFTGTVPDDMGAFSKLEIFTLHGNLVEGTMPASVCSLRTTGNLQSLIADCLDSPPEIECSCCTDCRA